MKFSKTSQGLEFPFAALASLCLTPLLLAGCGGGGGTPAPAGSRYVLTDLLPSFGPQMPAQGSEATALNDLGQVTLIGSRQGGGPESAIESSVFLYADGAYTSPPLFRPRALNNKGQIVDYNGLYQNGVLSSIPTLDTTDSTFNTMTAPYGINDAGQVVGTSPLKRIGVGSAQLPQGQIITRAVLYQNGHLTDLGITGQAAGTDGANLSSGAAAINNAGQVVGVFESGGVMPSGALQGHAFVYTNGVATDLGTLGGSNSGATALNNNGQIVGYAELAGSTPTTVVDRFGNTVPGPSLISTHAAFWRNGAVVDMSAPYNGSATGINDQGQAVGSFTAKNGDSHAFVYRDGKLLDLNTLLVNGGGWTLYSAVGINSKGQICGTGMIHGARHAFLLTPK